MSKEGLAEEFFSPKDEERISDQDNSSALGQDASASTSVPGQDEAPSMFATSKARDDLGPDYTRHRWFQLHENPEVNPYAAEQDKRYGMDWRVRVIIKLVIAALVALFVAVLLPSPTYNKAFAYTFSGVVTGLTDNVAQFLTFISGGHPQDVLNYKFYTYLIVFFAGIGLSITGAIYQGTLKNALASPTTLGVTSGATVGLALFTVLAPTELLEPVLSSTDSYASISSLIDYYNSLSLSDYLLVTQGRAFASIVGCLVVVAIVMLVAFLVGKGRSSSFALIICGMVVASVAQSAVEVIRYYVVEVDSTGTKSSLIRSAQTGSISTVSTPLDVVLVAVPIVICLVIIITLARKLNLLAFDDDEARSMGISTERLRWGIIGLCTLITAVIISFCGNISFVGFAIPLIARRLIGPDLAFLIPGSALLGGVFLIFSYWLTDFNIMAAFDIEFVGGVSLFTSMVGAVIFMVTSLKSRREAGGSGDWF